MKHIRTPVKVVSNGRDLVDADGYVLAVSALHAIDIVVLPNRSGQAEVMHEVADVLNAHAALAAVARSLLRYGMAETERQLPEIRAAAREALDLGSRGGGDA